MEKLEGVREKLEEPELEKLEDLDDGKLEKLLPGWTKFDVLPKFEGGEKLERLLETKLDWPEVIPDSRQMSNNADKIFIFCLEKILNEF